MRNKIAVLMVGGLTLVGGCGSFLTGPGLDDNPNDPIVGTANQLFAGVVASQVTQQEGLLPRLSSMFVQQMAGTGRQHQTMATYSVTEGDVNDYFDRIYAGGGLVDARRAQDIAREDGDSSFVGVLMFWEALNIGMAASIWGDIPYSEAVTDVLSPALDPQETVYAAVRAKLDTAILWIPKTGGTNVGVLPGVDLIYGGDRVKYVQAANTLKARLMMHWVEAQLTGGASLTAAQTACGGDCLTGARTAATAGINAVANDLRTFHSDVSSEWNIWHQFLIIERSGDVGAGKALVDTLKARRSGGDQRVRAYFDSVSVGAGFDFRGADPNGVGTPFSVLSATRISPSFRQPILTAAENSLIIAETNARLGSAGPALTALNAAKAFSATANGVTVPSVSGLSGTALLNAIKLEKWISLFQNIEAWNDFKRNCYPRLTPATGATDVPGRLQYGERERQTNTNIPDVASQPARNRNDPKPCSDPTHPA